MYVTLKVLHKTVVARELCKMSLINYLLFILFNSFSLLVILSNSVL